MRNGTYALHMTASEFSASATSSVAGGRFEGGDGAFRIEGTVVRKPTHAIGRFMVELSPLAIGNSHLPPAFPIETTGSASETDFALVGAGPLGLIIEVSGRWKS